MFLVATLYQRSESTAAMPRFFFDVHDGVEVIDDIGREFATHEEARHEALQLASDYAKIPDNLSAGGFLLVSARDGAGATVTTIRLVCQID